MTRRTSNRIFPKGIQSRNPEDTREFEAQIAAEPEKWYAEYKAYPPQVRIKNNIFPELHEIYNCTTCFFGGLNFNPDGEHFRIYCREFHKWSNGSKWNDIECPKFDTKSNHPSKRIERS